MNAYEEGYTAFINDLPLSDNPYVDEENEVEADEWEDGWEDAEADTL